MMKLRNLCIIATTILIISCSNEPFELFDIGKIDANSELFDDLKIFSEIKSESEDAVCVTFIYPFNVYRYNDESEIVDSQIIRNNLEFIAALDNTEDDSAIGLSYPISSVLEDGTSFTINNNEELKTAIESCIESEIIRYCEGVLEETNCIWQITSSTENERYNDSVMDFYEDGTGVFYDQGTAYRISWIALFVVEELHINLHLEGNSEIIEDWNFNWKVISITDESIEIANEDQSYTITKKCGIPNSCNYVEFRECPQENTEDKATFILDDYKDCIISLQQNTTNNSNVSLMFFEDGVSAEQDLNAIDSSGYQNITNPQIVYVKVNNKQDDETYIIKIVLFVEACESDDER
ncbi:hypothetical protein [Aquimarina spongiae]|nr:hypothetical protein [Aquimarina spongiae]